MPEQFFNDPNALQKNAEGVSAVKILKLAAESGQTIYQIDQSNIDVVLPKLQHSAMVLQDVKDGVAAGKVVTISESSINFKGWVGSGYTVLDKTTGTGAYMISGGMNGSFILGLGVGGLISGIVIVGVLSPTAPILLPILALILLQVAALLTLIGIMMVLTGGFDIDCFTAGLLIGLVASGMSALFNITTLIPRILAGIGHPLTHKYKK